MNTIGVVIGRFQVAQLHEGHIALLSAVQARCTRMVVFVGVSPAVLNAHDPLPYFCRQDAIQSIFPQATVLPLYDTPDDGDWSRQVDTLLQNIEARAGVTIYGGRQSSVRHYSGRWPIEELPLELTISGTEMRKAQDLGYSYEFRTGMIYAAQMRFPTSYQTVDVACLHGDQVLLGKKSDEEGWRFPGGFVDVQDASLAHAAVRELREECGKIETGGVPEMKFIDSVRIADWRYRASVDGIMTAFFTCPYKWGEIRADDDLMAVAWMPRDNLRALVEPAHLPLVDLLERADVRREPLPVDG